MTDKRNKFKLPIGDWSGDGHGVCDYYLVSSVGDMDTVLEAFERAKEKLPKLNPQSFCCNYDDWEIPERVVKVVNATPELTRLLEQSDWDGKTHWSFTEGTVSMATYTVWYINQGNPNLDLRMEEEENSLPIITFPYNRDGNGGTSFIGYGLTGP